MPNKIFPLIFILLSMLTATIQPVLADQSILVQSTTSTQNSGLYDYLLPKFESETGIKVNVVAVGTGQAIRNAKNGDADVLLVHSKASELAFVADGYGVERFDLMYNDFVIIGPKSDDIDLESCTSLNQALVKIAQSDTSFISRGDDSGTHKKELQLWKNAQQLDAIRASASYKETGSGMGATIRMATEMNGYTMTDRATWIAFNDKKDHEILVEGFDELFNQYGLIMVNSAKHPHVNTTGAQAFMDWLLGSRGQDAIAAYTVAGQQLFFPNAAD